MLCRAQDVELLDEAGRPLLRCAVANGFRNIQTLMRQVKSGRCPYHYVEVRLGVGSLGREAVLMCRGVTLNRDPVLKKVPTWGAASRGASMTLRAEHPGVRCVPFGQVMACPSGCLNGGGQLKPSQPGQTAQQVRISCAQGGGSCNHLPEASSS